MESWRQFWTEVEELERSNLISLPSIKRWFALLGITVAIFCYSWNSIFRGSGFEHFPKAMIPFEGDGSKVTFMSEADARKFQLKEINVVITAVSKARTTGQEELEPEVVKDAIITMKSTVMHTRKVIHFHIFTTDRLYQYFIARLDRWPNDIRHRVSFNFYPTVYPETVVSEYNDEDDEPSRSPLLFVPHILKDIDYIMYIKAGGIFLQSVDQLWSNLEEYKSNHVMSLAPHNIYSVCPVKQTIFTIDKVFSSSVILLDLYKLRTAVFEVPIKVHGTCPSCTVETNKMTWSPNMVLAHVKTYSSHLQVTQQDILNLIAYYNPTMISQLSHTWKYDVDSIHQASDEIGMLNPSLVFSSLNTWDSNLKNAILNDDFRNNSLVDWYLQRMLCTVG